ncbi:uncharacterized protein LOC141601363 [Silene latifolia]|uniref:uncharacterized protein LOC141601363 n=1 Tax=Silene latifolia TaxID=37657 RepID=UPI003D77A300
MYLNGIDDNLAAHLVRLAGFKMGQFPFRYLGVPISSKRLSVADCNRVVDKIVARIRGWGAKHLSYAGRLVLVKAVLTQMHAYWARIFLLPKGVIHKVECICKNYLWAGHAEYKHSPPVAWETCCLPKEQGGLGIINCHLWNAALIGKYAWWIHSKKESLWVQWVHHIYIKHKDWWMYNPTQNSSWVWRQICKVKDILKPGFLNGGWDGSYTIQKGYQWLLGPRSKKDWVPMVWNRVCLPKHNFSTWIYVQQRFLTQDRLQKFGVVTDGECYLCGVQLETHSHLFFECVFSMQCLLHLQNWLQVHWQGNVMDWIIRWRCRSLMKKQVVMAAISGLIYSIWNCRNKCRLENYITQPRQVVKGVQQLIKIRVSKGEFDKGSVKCKAWLQNVLD